MSEEDDDTEAQSNEEPKVRGQSKIEHEIINLVDDDSDTNIEQIKKRHERKKRKHSRYLNLFF